MIVYLTSEELSSIIKYDARYIREHLKDKVFKRDIHYIRPFGGRKILYIWKEIEKLIISSTGKENLSFRKENPMDKIILRRKRNNGQN